MPHVFEHAPTGRAKCRGCGQPIAAGAVRFGERLPNPFADGDAEMTHWFHVACAAFKRPEPFLDALPSAAVSIDRRDEYAHEAQLGLAHRRLPRADAAGLAPSGRAACRACKEPIAKGSWRIGLVFYDDGRFAPSGYIHAGCARAYLETTEILPRVRHFSPALTDADAGALAEAIGGI